MSRPRSPVCESQKKEVIFVVESQNGQDRRYQADKRTLASASKVFDSMFQDLPSDKKCIIKITEFSPKAFKVMLKHVFGKPYSLTKWELAMEVFCVAEKYQICSLQRTCSEYLASIKVTSSDALEIFRLACKYNVELVQYACEEVFEKDLGDILLNPDFKNTEKEIVKKVIRHANQLEPLHMLALINWARHECCRQGKTGSAQNVESCVVSVCGTALAISVSRVIAQLSTMKKKRALADSEHQEKTSLQITRDVTISLHDSITGTMMSSFNIDIICEVKIMALKGSLEFTGIALRLKPRTSVGEDSLDIFYCTENISEGQGGSDVKFNGTMKEYSEIPFSQSLIVKPQQCATVTVRIEDLQMSRCLQNSHVEQSFFDKAKDIHFRLVLNSNQSTSSSHPGPFFIEKLFYKVLK